MRGVIFDLDGTLLDTLDDLADATNEALVKNGCEPHPRTAYRQFVGNGAQKLVIRAAGDADPTTIQQILTDFKECYRVRLRNKTHPYAGVVSLLQQLDKRSLQLAVCTNKPQAYVSSLLAHYFPGIPFVDAIGDRQDGHRKPDPYYPLQLAKKMQLPASSIVFVGDSDVDMRTGQAAGMVCAGVLWGFRTGAELQAAGADLLLEKPEDLVAFLEKM